MMALRQAYATLSAPVVRAGPRARDATWEPPPAASAQREGRDRVSILSGMHGLIASLILYTLLFADETGLPMPFAPNELLLIIAGVLIRSGALSLWAFVPVALIVMTAGMLVGYGWARVVGQPGLARLVRLVHAEAAQR